MGAAEGEVPDATTEIGVVAAFGDEQPSELFLPHQFPGLVTPLLELLNRKPHIFRLTHSKKLL